MIKKIFASLFAVWALIIFVITLLPVALLMWVIGLIDEPQRTKIFRGISYIWMRFFFLLTGCGIKIKGIKNFEKGKNYIITCNHNSFMDVPVATPFIPGANKTIAKEEMAKIPLFGLIYKRGSVLVNRNDKNSRKDSFKKMKEVLALGMHMCIYPEGTRNKTNLPLKEFHDGAFKLALDTQTEILPAILFGTREIMPPGKIFYFWPGQMEIHFLQPVSITAGESYENLKDKVFNLMQHHIVEKSTS
ncbi:MAG: lysophospholipid acyltransferase family protein [Ginsengibacter sp.]